MVAAEVRLQNVRALLLSISKKVLGHIKIGKVSGEAPSIL